MRGCAFVRGAEGWQKAPWAVLCPFKKMDFGHTPNGQHAARARKRMCGCSHGPCDVPCECVRVAVGTLIVTRTSLVDLH